MGRNLKTRVPCHPDELLPKLLDYDELCEREKKYREKMAQDYRYDHRHKVVLGEQLSPGDQVCILDLHTEGSVVKCHEMPKSVVIDTSKSTVRRNRRMTRKLESQSHDQPDGE